MGSKVSVKGTNGNKLSYNDKLWVDNTKECRSLHPHPCKNKRLEDGPFCERHEGQKGYPVKDIPEEWKPPKQEKGKKNCQYPAVKDRRSRVKILHKFGNSMGMLLLSLFAFFTIVYSTTCQNTPDSLRVFRGASETIVYAQNTGSSVTVLSFLKASSTTQKFTTLQVEYSEGAHALPAGSKGVYFGHMVPYESKITVTCAVVVVDCLLESLRKNEWDLCGNSLSHCWTKIGEVEDGKTFVDYTTGEQCTCRSGSVLCERGLCHCTDVSGNKHNPGTTWKDSSCKECACVDKGGSCSFTCEEDVCLSFILPIAASVLVVGLLVGYVIYRMAQGKVLVDLDDSLPGADYTPLEHN